jgi:hypothetical protein
MAWRFGKAKKIRRIAGFVALLYALCVVAPAVSFALSDGSKAAHCLSDNHGLQPVSMHSHEHQGTESAHHGASQPQESQDDHDAGKVHDQCCGLFCLSALPSFNANVLVPAFARMALAFDRPDVVRGHVFSSFLRPPISSSSAALS